MAQYHFMQNGNPLKKAILALKVGGRPIQVTIQADQAKAHNYARYYGVKIRTQTRLDGAGWNIVRTK